MRYIFLILLFPIFLNFQSVKSDGFSEHFKKNRETYIGLGVAGFVGIFLYCLYGGAISSLEKSGKQLVNLEQEINHAQDSIRNYESTSTSASLFKKTTELGEYFIEIQGEKINISVPFYRESEKSSNYVSGKDVFEQADKANIKIDKITYFQASFQKIYNKNFYQYIKGNTDLKPILKE